MPLYKLCRKGARAEVEGESNMKKDQISLKLYKNDLADFNNGEYGNQTFSTVESQESRVK